MKKIVSILFCLIIPFVFMGCAKAETTSIETTQPEIKIEVPNDSIYIQGIKIDYIQVGNNVIYGNEIIAVQINDKPSCVGVYLKNQTTIFVSLENCIIILNTQYCR